MLTQTRQFCELEAAVESDTDCQKHWRNHSVLLIKAWREIPDCVCLCVCVSRFWLPDPSADVTGWWSGGPGSWGGTWPQGHLRCLWGLCQRLAGHGGEMFVDICVWYMFVSVEIYIMFSLTNLLCHRWSRCPSLCWTRNLVKTLSSPCRESSRFRVRTHNTTQPSASNSTSFRAFAHFINREVLSLANNLWII